MAPLKIDLGKNGFNAVLKSYQIEIMKYLWAYSNEGQRIREIYDAVNLALPVEGSISRASITTFLNDFVEDGVLRFHTMKGNSGPVRIYWSRYDESGFKRYIVETVVYVFMDDFPEETKEAISTLHAHAQ